MKKIHLEPSSTFSSLYLHFPFCETKCHYCDFYSLAASRTQEKDKDRFAQALKNEVILWLDSISSLETIFLGGGTPSMTAPSTIEWIFESLLKENKIHETTEWNMEVNPSSVDIKSLTHLGKLGVNRISMGVQSMNPVELKILGRVHDPKQVHSALESIIKSGIPEISVDVICGVPGQTLQSLEKTLKVLTKYPITHLSCYLLTLPSHHRMAKDLPNDDTQLEHLLFINDFLQNIGFEHYEISNFCRNSKKAQHNMNYWKGKSYLGLGPSAHSYDPRTQTRWKNYSSIHRYADFIEKNEFPIEWTEALTPSQVELEKWLLALRLNEGFPYAWLEKKAQKQKAEQFLRENLLEIHPDDSNRLRPTPRGYALNDLLIQSLST